MGTPNATRCVRYDVCGTYLLNEEKDLKLCAACYISGVRGFENRIPPDSESSSESEGSQNSAESADSGIGNHEDEHRAVQMMNYMDDNYSTEDRLKIVLNEFKEQKNEAAINALHSVSGSSSNDEHDSPAKPG